MESPKLKNRYPRSSASQYAAMSLSRGTSADSMISMVVRGMWKLVNIPSMILNS